MKSGLPFYQLKTQFKKILWITAFWIIVAFLQYSNSYATLKYFEYDFSLINESQFLRGSIVTGLIAGLLGGSSIVFLWERWLRTRSYRISLLYIFISYTVIFLLVNVLSQSYNYNIRFGLTLADPEFYNRLLGDFRNLSVLSVYFFWLVVVLITLIALLVNDKYGPGVFGDFLLGKYFHPRREERIFMFLDLRSSTSIAERLGESQYFNLLKELYRDMTSAILRTEGEVYQYVGDEIVISWSQKKGSRNSNAIQCFYHIQQTLSKKAPYYQSNYNGIRPEFKAGLHLGTVMAGEIGIIKRDIAYSGDVLNTTARIQSKCNELGVNILLSKYLLDSLAPVSPVFDPVDLGEFQLRGKQNNLQLFTIQD